MINLRLLAPAMLVSLAGMSLTATAESPAKHLFILSGQSNMQGLRPEESFTPTVEAEFGQENTIVVKDAQGGQPIRRWYRQWKSASGDAPKSTGDLYDRLLKSVRAAIKDEKFFASVSFYWMQGERDAKEKHGDVYAKSLSGVVDQLKKDLGIAKIHVVIGRLSDYDLANKRYAHWTKVREAQVKLAGDLPSGAWIDTDDLNDGENRSGKKISNDLHMSGEGYKTMGKRFADAGIKLIKAK